MKRISHTKAFIIDSSTEGLFPLFSPEGEKRWVPGWDYVNVMGTTELAEDDIFLTSSHDHRSTDAVWIVKTYDPEKYFVQYYKVEPLDKVGMVSVKCIPLEENRTEVHVTYVYTALSTLGEAFVSGFTQRAYEDFIGEWETLLTDYVNRQRASENGTR